MFGEIWERINFNPKATMSTTTQTLVHIRQSYHKYDIINEHEVILHSYDMDWNPTCDHKIIWNGNFWVAQTCGECIVKNIRIESEFKFNQEKCFSRDAGFNEDGKLVWGKEDGLFDFDRVV